MMGGAVVHTIVSQLYLNGLCGGIYSVYERPDQHFAAKYLGGERVSPDEETVRALTGDEVLRPR